MFKILRLRKILIEAKMMCLMYQFTDSKISKIYYLDLTVLSKMHKIQCKELQNFDIIQG